MACSVTYQFKSKHQENTWGKDGFRGDQRRGRRISVRTRGKEKERTRKTAGVGNRMTTRRPLGGSQL